MRETTSFTEWLDQAYEQGYKAGFAESRAKGMRVLLQKVIEKKFCPLVCEVKERLQPLDNDTLDALGDVLYDMTTIDELRAWLTHRTVSRVMN